MQKIYQSKFLRIFLQLVISIGLLVYVFWHLDAADILDIVSSAAADNLAWAFGCFFLIRILMALRWQLLLKSSAVPAPFCKVFESLQASLFLGNLLPAGTVVSDLVRGYTMARYSGSLAKVAQTLLADRIFGLFSMLLMSLVGCLVLGTRVGQNELFLRLFLVVAGMLIAALGCMVGLGFWCRKKIRPVLGKSIPLPSGKSITGKLANLLVQFGDPVWFARSAPTAMLYSLGVQLLRCAMFFFIFTSIQAPVSFNHTIAFIPLVFLLLSLPISIGGFGVRESSLAMLFGVIGISTELSISAGLILFLLQICGSLPFFLSWLFRSKERIAGVTA